MTWEDKVKHASPEKIAYLSDCLVIEGIKYECPNPRLEFIRALMCLESMKPPNGIDASVKIGQNTVIGEDGFGYEPDENGVPIKMPHFGNVVIGKNVEIGSNTCIDRAVIGSTIIEENVKIDNLVHIAHGARICKNTCIVAGAVIGGSVKIGRSCFIGMGALIKNKVRIGDNVIVGMGAVVINDVSDGWTVVGNPAKRLLK